MIRAVTLPRSLLHATRRLERDRRFSLAVILTLALGLGATTAVFAVVYSVLLRPLPYPEPDRLVSLSHTLVVNGTLRVNQTDASLLFFQRHHRPFTHLGGYQVTAAGLGPAGGTDAEHVSASRVTVGFFATLGVAPLRGRFFTESDDRPGAAPVALIGERLWARKYGGDAGIVGRQADIDGVPHEILGVVPDDVDFPTPTTELWVPMQLDPEKTDSASFDYQAVARLRSGVTTEAAAAELQTLLPSLPDEFPGRLTRPSIEQTHMRVSVDPLADLIVGDIGRVLWIVLGAAVLVLAIACSNVANLFFVRAERRANGVAIERALGATSGVIVLEFMSEGLLVAAAAGALAMAFAAAGLRAVRTFAGGVDLPRLHEIGIDRTVVLVAALSALAAALVINTLPTLRAGPMSSGSLLPSAGGSSTIGRNQHRVRNALVVVQVGFALVLLVSAGLMARSVWRLRSVAPGFEPARATTFRLALPAAAYPGTDRPVRFIVRAADEIAAIHGVTDVGVASKVPLDDQGRVDSAVFVEGRTMAPGSLPGIHPVVYVTPEYFAAAGIPVLEGRSFMKPDPPRVALEVIVSRAFAERYWKTDSPIGKRIRLLVNGPWYIVTGVVGNVRDSALDRPVDQIVYCPLLPAREDSRWAPRDLAFVVRTRGDSAASTAAARSVVRGLDPSLPVYRVRPLTDVVAHASARRSVTFLLLACATGVALLLGTVGLYGVMSYVVALRTREIGVRLALGAQPREIIRSVCQQGLAMATVGIAVGLAGALMLTRFLASLVFEVNTTDPVVLAVSAIGLLLIAAIATWLPARKAASIDPSLTLRSL
jgi:putative ABC transport system permease protein